jgi:uncharacterized protein
LKNRRISGASPGSTRCSVPSTNLGTEIRQGAIGFLFFAGLAFRRRRSDTRSRCRIAPRFDCSAGREVVMLESDVPACLSCGACCFSQLASYVRVTGADHTRLGARVDELTHFDGNRCYMNMHEGHCAALVIDLPTRQFVCSIYETRPSTCRDLARGSAACRGELHEKRERPLLSVRFLPARR